ncbi:protein MALE DISCOVERER 2 isoform X1 [Morus notabilis]|uniref:protein MALE DISCOVERER 2 isoform X1 n=1 Tax=Morus notabilis TaxID=981085 RepID=UPI000CECEA53|nr:protein MALE DISCOVERER 2 isoform X1 [Morus notabilis]XP_024016955.1 protein MALE DISCOVERER 2 isoform X1 [Morus notabilis]
MGDRWDPFGFGFSFFLALILFSGTPVCWSLNDEGILLLAFRVRINSDPFGALESWNHNDESPCLWWGVNCQEGKVQMLNMSGLSLQGTLAPELGKLPHLRALVLYKNHFSGAIPKDIGELRELELLDLRDNNLSGTIPAEIGSMQSLKYLLLCDNRFEGSLPMDLGRLNLLSEFQFDNYLAPTGFPGIGGVSRKFGHWFSFKKDPLHSGGHSCCENLPSASEPHVVESGQNFVSFSRRRLLEQASNLPAAPASGESSSGKVVALPMTRSSGSFRAVPARKRKHSPAPSPLPSSASLQKHHPLNPEEKPSGFPVKPITQPSSDSSSGNMWKYVSITGGVSVFLIVAAAMFCMCRSKAVKTIGPWKTGLSGQLQKAFITGVPKLNRSELESACEDFSNIISTVDGCTVYKGTLSSGVEIAVASTTISSFKDWTKVAEMAYRKKIDTLSRVNHKNFVNLIGYCEEDEPFVRMMVFEYAPNGSLFEHLHVKEVEHLDWNARMRIVMGTAYCLQYMHHDLNPPVAHPNLNSTSIYLTDDYAAKIADIGFTTKHKSKHQTDDDKENSELPPSADPETNVYCFGILLLEIISGKLSYSEEQGSLVNWAADYLNDKRSISYMIDPSLKSFKNNELDVICEVIQDCIPPDPRQRPTMKEITSKLREVIVISPDQATPRLSPLWWAELEILSVEAT